MSIAKNIYRYFEEYIKIDKSSYNDNDIALAILNRHNRKFPTKRCNINCNDGSVLCIIRDDSNPKNLNIMIIEPKNI